MKSCFKILCCLMLVLFFSSLAVCAPANVRLVQNSKGIWKLLVNNKPYFVKGLEYSADTIGVGSLGNNEWMFSDINDNGKIDGPYDSWVDLNKNNYQDNTENSVGDFALMKSMGCNTIRIYHCENVNKELLRDLYKNYGIMVIMGDYLGAYTKGSGASWNSGTDYSNKVHKANMLNSVRKMVTEHKDEPYVLMWLLGNENDSKGSAGNSTLTNTNAVKNPRAYAEFVEEACKLIKSLDSNHPVGTCNAGVSFLSYYAKYTPSLDFFGINKYSTPYGFGTLWNKVKQVLNKPVLVTEFGCDVYNTKKSTTDERYQANYHKNSWKNIENNSFWGDGVGNSIGGVVYCWMDKWWLIGSSKQHDTTLGTWEGSTIDGLYNDEWLGVCSQGKGKDSPFLRQLRNVYYLYQEQLWDWDPATYKN